MDFETLDAEAVLADLRASNTAQVVRDHERADQEVARLQGIIDSDTFTDEMRAAASLALPVAQAAAADAAALAKKLLAISSLTKAEQHGVRQDELRVTLEENERAYLATQAQIEYETQRHELIPDGGDIDDEGLDERERHARFLDSLEDALALIEVTHGVLVAALNP